MIDPIRGLLGQLICGGWIGEDLRDGSDLAFLFLATPGGGALGLPVDEAMGLLAGRLGIDSRPGRVTLTPPTASHVEVRPRDWAALVVDGETVVERPTSPDWIATACAVGRVALGVAYTALPPGVPVEDHTDGPSVLALLTVTDTRR
ncbi:hypothetical protein [Saccharothrix xinjiangensis]|uniref:Immunity protein 21 of polymorphic toxin system n=1 Tax=Saccharothrix xinjiangensis TaxID=204798 RepID=A0ABV9XTM9_9PSEU